MDRVQLEEFRSMVIGKTIKDVVCYIVDNSIAIEAISFDDGTKMELWGSCDYCLFDSFEDDNGNKIFPEIEN